MSDAPSATPSWEPPSAEELGKLLPQYEVEKLLGRGGMGAVFKGRQVSLDRPIAIKILSSNLDTADGSFAGRFQNEARAMARMSHPGIVEVYQFGRTDTGLLYIVMEFIEGTDVAKMIARKGHLPVDHALAITAHVCDALQYAHDRGIVHRDIKPANIMVGYDGVVKVADFGLAKATETEDSGLTRSGTALGTLHFMAPESLILGSVVDHRADIYAVGVMLYQMLTGKLPQGVFKLPSALVDGMDHRFDDILKKALREDRDVRYQSAAELRADLDAILTQPVAKVEADATHAPAALSTMERPQRPADGPADDPLLTVYQRKRPLSSFIWVTLLVTAGLLLWASQHWQLTIETSPPKAAPAQDDHLAQAPVVPPPPKPATPLTTKAEPVELPAPAPKPEPDTTTLPVLATVAKASIVPPGKVARVTDLLPLVDPASDRLAGKWTRVPEGILCEAPGRLQLPHALTTDEFDYEYEFSLVSPKVGWVCVRFPAVARRIPWTVQEHPKKPNPFYHFPFLDNAPAAAVTEVVVQRPEILVPGKRYHCVLKVRKDSLEAVWNDVPILYWEGDLRRFRHDAANPTTDPRYLDIGVNSGSVLFHKVQVTEFFPAGSNPELAALKTQWQTLERDKILKAHDAALIQLDAGFLGGLDRLSAEAAKAGQASLVSALAKEKVRLALKQPLPASDDAVLPDDLKRLRSIYRTELAKLDRQRAETHAALVAPHLVGLRTLEAELTQSGRADEAVAVKSYHDAIATPAKSPSKVEAQPSGDANSDRMVAEWALAKGGHVWIYGTNVAITRGADLPGRDIVIKKLVFWDDDKTIKAPNVGTQDMLRFRGLEWLKELELRANPIGDAGLQILADLPSLTALRVHACGVSDAGLAHIAKLVDLQTLDVGYTGGRITDAGAAHLSKLTKLRWLNIYDSKITDKTLSDVLAKLPSLNWVELTATKVTANGVLAFKKAKPKCRVVKYN